MEGEDVRGTALATAVKQAQYNFNMSRPAKLKGWAGKLKKVKFNPEIYVEARLFQVNEF